MAGHRPSKIVGAIARDLSPWTQGPGTSCPIQMLTAHLYTHTVYSMSDWVRGISKVNTGISLFNMGILHGTGSKALDSNALDSKALDPVDPMVSRALDPMDPEPVSIQGPRSNAWHQGHWIQGLGTPRMGCMDPRPWIQGHGSNAQNPRPWIPRHCIHSTGSKALDNNAWHSKAF